MTSPLLKLIVIAVLTLVAACSDHESEGGHQHGPGYAAWKEGPSSDPLSPQDALKSFRLQDGYHIELAAAEPLVQDPVALKFDARGRMWVVEMRDYPNGPASGQPPLSRIRVLEDRDGDGRFETSRLFADKLLFATGVQPWRDGVIVTMAGQVAFMKDTDGDHRADQIEKWYEGFTIENPQLRANHPTLGLDQGAGAAQRAAGGELLNFRRVVVEIGRGDQLNAVKTGAVMQVDEGKTGLGVTAGAHPAFNCNVSARGDAAREGRFDTGE